MNSERSITRFCESVFRVGYLDTKTSKTNRHSIKYLICNRNFDVSINFPIAVIRYLTK